MTISTHSNRAQTAQDFAVGISIFLLTVGFVFAFVPNLLSPFDTQVGSEQQAQADRAATVVTAEITHEGDSNVINETAVDYFDTLGSGVESIQNETGLPFTARINVTVTEIGGTDPEVVNGQRLAAGPQFLQGQPAASESRILILEGSQTCDPGCELTVRVW
jgi:hypothetical protein